MDFKQLYLSTDGRISRKTWWIGALILAVANIVIAMVILPLIGLGGPNVAQIMSAANDPAQVNSVILGSMQTAAWGGLIITLLFAYPMYCLSVKRRRDRNSSGMDVAGYLALMVLLQLVQALGLGFSVVDVQGVPVPMPSMLFNILSVVVGIYGLYLLVVLGFLKGTTGSNSYGADPLSGGVAAAA